MIWSLLYTRETVQNCVTVDAVRRNPQSARATDKDVAEAAKVWLKHAKDRLGGRAARQTNGPRLAQ